MTVDKCCATCGFLGLRARTSKALSVAHVDYRTKGKWSVGVDTFDSTPVCMVRAIDLETMSNEQRGGMRNTFNDLDVNLATIRSNGIHCDNHVGWVEGLSAKDHMEMKQLKEQRAWQSDESRKADNRHREAMGVQTRSYLIAAIIGFVGGLAAVGFASILSP